MLACCGRLVGIRFRGARVSCVRACLPALIGWFACIVCDGACVSAVSRCCEICVDDWLVACGLGCCWLSSSLLSQTLGWLFVLQECWCDGDQVCNFPWCLERTRFCVWSAQHTIACCSLSPRIWQLHARMYDTPSTPRSAEAHRSAVVSSPRDELRETFSSTLAGTPASGVTLCSTS